MKDMDQNGISKKAVVGLQIPTKSNKDYLFIIIKRALQFLVPVSFASFILTYTCTTYYFQYFSTLVFLLFSHAFERKYMFLICNGILAFLVKTLSFNNSNSTNPSSLSVLDGNDNDDSSTAKIITDQSTIITEEEEAAAAEPPPSESDEDVPEEEEEERLPIQVDAVNVSSSPISAAEETGDFIIETEELLDDNDYEEYIEEEDGSGSFGGALLGEDKVDVVNMNTEELNKKFEEFIRKMKEELRIQDRQQLIAAV